MTTEGKKDMAQMLRLDGRVALVTGAGRGIGEGIARFLAAAGAQVVLCGTSYDDAYGNYLAFLAPRLLLGPPLAALFALWPGGRVRRVAQMRAREDRHDPCHARLGHRPEIRLEKGSPGPGRGDDLIGREVIHLRAIRLQFPRTGAQHRFRIARRRQDVLARRRRRQGDRRHGQQHPQVRVQPL